MSKFSVPDPDAQNQNQDQEVQQQAQPTTSKFAVPVPDAAGEEQAVSQEQFQPASNFNAESGGYTQEVQKSTDDFMAKVDIFNRQFERMALGTMQFFTPDNSTVGQAVENVRKEGTGDVVVGEQGYQDAWENLKDPMTGEYDQGAYTAQGLGLLGSNIAYGSLLQGAGSAIGKGIGMMGGAGANVVSKAGEFSASHPVISKMINGAAIGGTMTGMEDADTSGEKLTKMGIGAFLGGSIPALVKGTSKVGEWLTPNKSQSGFLKSVFSPKKAALSDTVENIKSQFNNNIDDTITAVEKAQASMKKSGIHQTPGEVFDGAKIEEVSGIRPTQEQKNLFIKPNYFTQQNKVKGKLYEIVNKMAPDDVVSNGKVAIKKTSEEYIDASGKIVNKPTINNIETKTPSTIVGTDGKPITESIKVTQEEYIPKIIKENKILSDKYTEVLNGKSPEYQNLPNTSIAKFHKIKDSIDDDLIRSNKNSSGVVEKPLDLDTKLALKHARKILTEQVLSKSENYKVAMKNLQAKAIKDTYQNIVGRKAMKGKNIGVDEIQGALLNKGITHDQFIRDIVKTGGDVEDAKAVIDAIYNLSKSPQKVIVNKPISSDSNFQSIYSKSTAVVQQASGKITDSGYTKAMIELSLDPEWASKVINVLKTQKGPKQHDMLMLIVKDVLKKSVQPAPSRVGAKIYENTNK